MRFRMLILVVTLGWCAAGCLPVPSLYPLVGEGQGITVPGIVGQWGDSTTSVRFEQGRDPRYTMTLADSSDTTFRCTVLFTRLGGRLFADALIDDSDLPGGSRQPMLWPMHLIYRVDLAGDSLLLAFLDDEWVDKAIARHDISVRHERPGGTTILTEQTRGLQAMIRKVANVKAAFDSSATWAHRR